MWPFRRRKRLPKKTDVQATQVRVKSITRPLTKRGTTPPPSQSPTPGQLTPMEAAVVRLLRTSSWTETRQVLEEESQVLLTDDAQAVLNRFARDARSSGVPEAANIAMYLEAHRLLLDRARAVGIDHAWDEFLAMRPVPEKVSRNDAANEAEATMAAVRELLGTESWPETRHTLIQNQQRLLTDSADQLISALIQLAMQETSPEAIESIRYLELHRTLLRDARHLGIEQAWDNFESARIEMERDRARRRGMPSMNSQTNTMPNPAAVSEALRALLTTNSWDETRHLLESSQSLLLTDLCDLFLSQLIAAAQHDPDARATRGIVYLELHQRLLRRARNEGIPAAWNAFERELAQAQGAAATGERPPTLHGGHFDMAAVHRAVRELISAPSLRQERTVLEARRGVLLTDPAIRVIEEEADKMERRGTQLDLNAVRQMRKQVNLLRRARQIGLDRAWSEYETDLH